MSKRETLTVFLNEVWFQVKMPPASTLQTCLPLLSKQRALCRGSLSLHWKSPSRGWVEGLGEEAACR